MTIFIAGSTWLFYASAKLTDPDAGKNWWAIYFVGPDTKNLNFTIENHSNQTAFHWEVLVQNQKIKEGDVRIEKGAAKDVILDENLGSGKITIDVTTGNEKKEIYKNF